MANVVRNPYSNTAGNTPSSLGNGQIGVNQADGRLFYRAASGAVTTFSSIASYATVASFPATGSTSVLYLASDTSRIHQWTGSVYVEVGAAGNAPPHASSHATGGSDAITPESIGAVATSDSRLTDARAPTSHAHGNLTNAGAIGSSSGQVVVTTTSGVLTTAATISAASQVSGLSAVATSGSAADLSAGTLDDARLSGNVLLAATLAARQHQATAFIDAVDRTVINTAVPPVSNATYWTFFTPPHTVTVSQIAFACTTAASGVTLCRFGIYTADASGNATLVARTASDTTIFSTSNTVFTRSLNATGGYPASYTLLAGTRYAVAMCIAAANTGAVSGTSIPSVIAALSPRVQGVRTGTNDLLTSQAIGQYNGTVGHMYWARLS